MKILFIAPLPINWQSKTSKVLLDKLLYDKHAVTIVNLSKSSLKNGFDLLKRVFDIFYILVGVWKKRKNNDIMHFNF